MSDGKKRGVDKKKEFRKYFCVYLNIPSMFLSQTIRYQKKERKKVKVKLNQRRKFSSINALDESTIIFFDLCYLTERLNNIYVTVHAIHTRIEKRSCAILSLRQI